MPSSFMHFLTRYSIVPANSSGRNSSANLAPKVRSDSSHTRFTSALNPAHGSSGSPLASQLQKPDLDTSSTLAIFSADLSPSSPFHENEGALLAQESEEAYRIVSVCFDHEGNELAPAGILPIYDTGCPFPTFGIVKPAVTNTRADMSPYGQSVFADAVDAVQAVDLTFDAFINEIDLSKMRVFLSDVLFDREQDGNKNATIPFDKQDCTVFRKVMSTEDAIQEFAPALRTNGQIKTFRVAPQMFGNPTGFGISYFDMDELRGYVKTATEVSSDNSALMRNILRHKNGLEGSIVSIARAVMHASRSFGDSIPDEGETRIQFDDSIIQDTAAEGEQDMKEVGVTLSPWEYRMRWYGEEESVARARAAEIGTVSIGNGGK